MVAHHTKDGQHMGEEHQIEERLEKEHHMEEDHYMNHMEEHHAYKYPYGYG